MVDVRLITYTSQPSCTSARSASASFSCLRLAAIARRAGGSARGGNSGLKLASRDKHRRAEIRG